MKSPVFICSAITVALTSTNANAATCSCAGVPMLNSVSLSSPNQDSWYLTTSFELHEISDLYSGTNEVNDETDRDRSSNSTLIQLGYGFNQHWSVSTMLSFIEHERSVGTSQNSYTRSSGLGDGVVLLKYTPSRITPFSRLHYSFGIGAKIPLGEDNKSSNGVRLAEDMQPSTGAYSTLLWGYVAKSFSAAANWQVYSAVNYADNGKNDFDYQFGNEFNISLGVNYQDESPWGYTAALQYRTTDSDNRAGSDIPNTGGQWITFSPTLAYSFDEKLALSISARIPIHRDLDGQLQFTTSWASSVSLTYLF